MRSNITLAIAAAATLATTLASPALAQKRHDTNARGAFAQAQQQALGQQARNGNRAHSGNAAYDAYDTRGYVGSDPDPLVRDLLKISPSNER